MSTFDNMKSHPYENQIKTVNINSYDYERNIMLSQCNDVILEAKRVIVNEDVELIDRYTSPCPKKCNKLLDWKNDSFWNNLPNPKNHSSNKVFNKPKNDFITKQYVDTIFGDMLQRPAENKSKTTNQNNSASYKTTYLSQKYFNIWKNAVEFRKAENKHAENEVNKKLKLEAFMKKLKKRKRSEEKADVTVTNIIENYEAKVIANSNSSINSGHYKNRFNAQKVIIQMQKSKLEEQHKIIQDLKLGIISDDLLKSIENTKTNIRELFGNCSQKVKYKIPLILSEEPKFSISSQGAPKIVQKMEQRAVERAKNRDIILERKRLIEEARQKMLQEAIENKRILEEEEKKRNLELIKERRRKEMEVEKMRQVNKQKYLEKLNRALNFYNNLLKRQYFKKLYDNMKYVRRKYALATEYYEINLYKKIINNWQFFVENKYKMKYEIADAHFEYKTLKRSIKVWRKIHINNIRDMQVAEDFYDFRLTSNVFIHWNRYVCVQFMKEHNNMKKAERHYNRWLLFHYFFLWRSLKTVNELEKAKELKKAKWRQKVWEILPDYKPPEEF